MLGVRVLPGPYHNSLGYNHNRLRSLLTRQKAIATAALSLAFACTGSVGMAQDQAGPPEHPHATVCGVPQRGLPPCLPIADTPAPRLATKLAFYGGIALADLATTEMFRARGVAEANPIMQSRGARLALEAAAAFASAKLEQVVTRHAPPSRRWICRAVVTAGTAWIVKRNIEAWTAAGRR